MPLTVREARPDDRHAIVNVTLAAYQEYATQVPFWDAYRKNILSTIANPHPATQLVADLDGTIVGTVLLYPAPPPGATIAPGQGRWPEVRLLAVAPSARGKGIALALMQDCVARARAAKADALTLHTMPAMQSALRLYTRMGFQPAPELNFQPAPNFTVKGYRLTLGPPIE
jgi:ribosomal protein S18 acetylase RimI-like enzyme